MSLCAIVSCVLSCIKRSFILLCLDTRLVTTSYPQLVAPSSPVGVVGAGFGGYLAMLLLDAAPAPAMCAAVTQPVVDWTRHGGRYMISANINIYKYLHMYQMLWRRRSSSAPGTRPAAS